MDIPPTAHPGGVLLEHAEHVWGSAHPGEAVWANAQPSDGGNVWDVTVAGGGALPLR
ncbi:hypothetical protein [Salinactinospora qingdaonensis]